MKFGLSILIPIYNKDVIRLVVELQQQCEAFLPFYEIVCLDDHSDSKYDIIHQSLNKLNGVKYLRLDKNIGRSAIRNQLANHSQCVYLLFLDCDSVIVSRNFIRNYWQIVLAHNSDFSLVVYGGTCYQENKPPNNFLLHWNYGRKVESQAAHVRQQDSFVHFKSNNFIISHAFFNRIQFDESIKGYGYEDVVLGQRFMDEGAKMLHTDNAVLHDGIEDNVVYISKIETAMDNLVQLVKEGKISKGRLIVWAKMFQKWNLSVVIFLFSKPLCAILKKLLVFMPGQVFLLQCYKLVLFIKGYDQK